MLTEIIVAFGVLAAGWGILTCGLAVPHGPLRTELQETAVRLPVRERKKGRRTVS